MIKEFESIRYGSIVLTMLLITTTATLQATASGTSPPLAIQSVEVDYTKEDGTLVRVDGTFPFEDLIDLPYPLQLLVRKKEKFLCFSVPWGPMGGELEELKDLKDGLTSEVVDLIGIFAQPDSEAKIVSVGPKRMEVLLPPDFPTGDAKAQIFVMYLGAPLFSNPVAFKIKKESW